MRVKRWIIKGLLVAILFICIGMNQNEVKAGTSVSPLHVDGTVLKNQNGQIVQLHGVSTHGLAWYPEYVSYDGFKTLRDDWGVNVVRLAMYTQEYGGYCSGGNQGNLKELIDKGVKYASDLGMYVIIDWHILSDGNPWTHQSEAISFFDEMSGKYAGYDNVIYEICNEPQNSDYNSVIKPYAETVIPVIRAHDSDAIILVGTNTWSQDVDAVIGNKINDANVMYTLHFYAATHGDYIRNKLQAAINNGVPVFVSECSIGTADGNGGIDYSSANQWINLLNDNHISFVAWSLSNKNETSALINSGCSKLSGWSDSELSDTGRWFKEAIKKASEGDYANFTGMAQFQGEWRYFRNGCIDLSYTGMAENSYGWWYFTNGSINWTYTGMAENSYGWWYYVNGRLDWTYTGMAENSYGWWYYTNGRIDWTYTGMAENQYGWWYYTNGRLDWTYTGMAENQYGWWYFVNGRIDWSRM